MSEFPLAEAARLVQTFGAGPRLARRISQLEAAAENRSGDEIAEWLEQEQLGADL